MGFALTSKVKNTDTSPTFCIKSKPLKPSQLTLVALHVGAGKVYAAFAGSIFFANVLMMVYLFVKKLTWHANLL